MVVQAAFPPARLIGMLDMSADVLRVYRGNTNLSNRGERFEILGCGLLLELFVDHRKCKSLLLFGRSFSRRSSVLEAAAVI